MFSQGEASTGLDSLTIVLYFFLLIPCHYLKNQILLGAGDGSGVKSARCCSRGPEFVSQHPRLCFNLTTTCDSDARGINTLLWPLQAPERMYTHFQDFT